MSDEFVKMFKYKTGYEIVEPAHMVIFYNLLSFFIISSVERPY